MGAEPSAYDRLRFDDAQLCTLLATGGSRRELQAVFGRPEYQLLVALAQRAARATRSSCPPVYVLPGIMGTQLGTARTAPLPADLLWIDPQDIIAGRLTQLRYGDPLVTLGAIPYTYLALQLRLQAAGFRVIMHEYDWRRSLVDLAAEFAARVRADGAQAIMIVAHSMGGLLARASLSLPGMERVQRLIALGVPHGGSFGAVQALRGTYPVVRRLAALDRLHDAETLAAQTFCSFPSLYQMLPPSSAGALPDLHDAASWPDSGPRPDPALLQIARGFIASLPPVDDRHCAIVGVGQRTVTRISVASDDLHYQISDAGDGTVPLDSARLDGCRNYQVRCEHSELPRSATVARALRELLSSGRTGALSPSAVDPAAARRPLRVSTVSDRQLRENWREKIDWQRCTPAARREYLNRLNQPPPQYAAPRSRRHSVTA
jgi:pimeloyl-ACP methyl ester carboxylesterase